MMGALEKKKETHHPGLEKLKKKVTGKHKDLKREFVKFKLFEKKNSS